MHYAGFTAPAESTEGCCKSKRTEAQTELLPCRTPEKKRVRTDQTSVKPCTGEAMPLHEAFLFSKQKQQVNVFLAKSDVFDVFSFCVNPFRTLPPQDEIQANLCSVSNVPHAG